MIENSFFVYNDESIGSSWFVPYGLNGFMSSSLFDLFVHFCTLQWLFRTLILRVVVEIYFGLSIHLLWVHSCFVFLIHFPEWKTLLLFVWSYRIPMVSVRKVAKFSEHFLRPYSHHLGDWGLPQIVGGFLLSSLLCVPCERLVRVVLGGRSICSGSEMLHTYSRWLLFFILQTILPVYLHAFAAWSLTMQVADFNRQWLHYQHTKSLLCGPLGSLASGCAVYMEYSYFDSTTPCGTPDFGQLTVEISFPIVTPIFLPSSWNMFYFIYFSDWVFVPYSLAFAKSENTTPVRSVSGVFHQT